jgi:hypothetical protein
MDRARLLLLLAVAPVVTVAAYVLGDGPGGDAGGAGPGRPQSPRPYDEDHSAADAETGRQPAPRPTTSPRLSP